MQDVQQIDGIHSLAGALLSYMQEIEEQRAIIMRHAESTAIHTASKELEVYRMFKRDENTAKALHNAVKKLPSWEDAPYWKLEGKKWMKLLAEVEDRMKKHNKQHPILTRGIAWNGRPILIHAYKFEPDPRMKIELIAPRIPRIFPESPIHILSEILQCHEYLIPAYSAQALPPYEGHDINFLTLSEYLSQNMSNELYASQCLQSINRLKSSA